MIKTIKNHYTKEYDENKIHYTTNNDICNNIIYNTICYAIRFYYSNDFFDDVDTITNKITNEIIDKAQLNIENVVVSKSTTLKVYAQKIPQYSHESITQTVVNNALNSWESVNVDLKFEYVDKRQDADITILFVTEITDLVDVMGITSTEIHEYGFGRESIKNEILIDLVDLDCNGIPIYYDRNSITNTIKHEIGHALIVGSFI